MRGKQNQAVLYKRRGYDKELSQEEKALADNFPVKDLEEIKEKDQVLCRYSILPFAKELQKEIENKGATMVASADSHFFLSDIRNWYFLLKDYTPQTWTEDEEIESEGPFFVKGIFNSRKEKWDTHAFAKDKEDLEKVKRNLKADPLIKKQPLIIREFVQLEKVPGTSLPLEYRLFIYKKKILSSGYYWSEELKEQIKSEQERVNINSAKIDNEFLTEIIDKIGLKADYYALDVAKTKEGWILIELNDATMSGLCGNSPQVLYKNLRKAIEQEKS